MSDRLSYAEKKNFQHLYTDYLKDVSIRCLTQHTSERQKRISDIALKN